MAGHFSSPATKAEFRHRCTPILRDLSTANHANDNMDLKAAVDGPQKSTKGAKTLVGISRLRLPKAAPAM
jgi:hypothetical protein